MKFTATTPYGTFTTISKTRNYEFVVVECGQREDHIKYNHAYNVRNAKSCMSNPATAYTEASRLVENADSILVERLAANAHEIAQKAGSAMGWRSDFKQAQQLVNSCKWGFAYIFPVDQAGA